MQHVLQLRPFIALRAENRLPGHKRPPCTDGLLNDLQNSLKVISSGTIRQYIGPRHFRLVVYYDYIPQICQSMPILE